jgi:molecular chaperone DnaJ
MANHYETLGVAKNASQDDIKKAYRKLAHKHHPDKNNGDKVSETKFKEINNAYEVLGDQKKRTQYDQFGDSFNQYGQQGGAGMGGFNYGDVQFDFGNGGASPFGDLNDVFETFFGSGFGASGAGGQRSSSGGKGRASRMKGVDIEMLMELTLEETARGAKKNFTYTHNTKCDHCVGQGHEPGSKVSNCDTCRGSGKVYQRVETIFGVIQQEAQCPTCEGLGKIYEKKCKVCIGKGYNQHNEELEVEIPVGVSSGDKVRVAGKGEAGYRGSEAGDLYLIIRLKEHKTLRKEGLDVSSNIEIGYFDVLLGKTIDVQTVWGNVEVTIPELSNPEGKLRLKEQGLPALNNPSKKGDHYIKLNIRMPSKLSGSQKEILQKIQSEVK